MAKAGDVFGYDKDDPLYDMEVTGVKEQVPNIPVTDAIGKGEKPEQVDSYIKQTATEEKTEAIAQKENVSTEEPKGLVLTDDMLIVDDRDGLAKPWSTIKGLAQLKKDTDAEKFSLAREREALAREKAFIEANKPFIDAAGQSKFFSTALTAISNGVDEKNAIAAGLAAIGQSPSPQSVQEIDPEPRMPSDVEFDINNPSHAAAAAEHMKWENRQEAKRMAAELIAPIQKRLDEYDRAIIEEKKRNEEATVQFQRIREHNATILKSAPQFLKFDPSDLSPEQSRQFWDRFNEAAGALGIDDKHMLNKGELAGILSLAVPGGANPFVVAQQRFDPKSVIPQQQKQPLHPGSSGGTPHGSSEFPVSEKDKMRGMLEKMSAGQPA